MTVLTPVHMDFEVGENESKCQSTSAPLLSTGWENLYHREPELGCSAGFCVYVTDIRMSHL